MTRSTHGPRDAGPHDRPDVDPREPSLAIRPSGDAALLLEVDSSRHALGLLAALDAARPPGVVDLVPGERTVLVVGDPVAAPPAALEAWVRATSWAPDGGRAAGGWAGAAAGAEHEGNGEADAANSRADTTGDVVELAVRYDGEDLAAVADALGRTPAEVVALHAASSWTVAFTGFAPGFAYLLTDHDRLVVPRRAEPRQRVPAGSVALAGTYCGVYPRASPGGWQLIGTTDAVLWDVDRPSPALLVPGTPVRFRPAGA